MDDQLSLFAAAPPAPQKFSLFLAIQPPPAVAAFIHEFATGFRALRGLSGRLRPESHLHITLHYFDQYSAIPASLVPSIDRACLNIARMTHPFEVSFDQILRFQGSGAVVLGQHAQGNSDLAHFHGALGKTLTIHAVPAKGHTGFTPHLTLQYTRESLPSEAIDPIRWTVEEFVLIRSEVGATRYEHLGRWKLQGR
jgi:RNA 2',3'-cyclic 3'-phosphodiesterase